ncbi:glycerol-3-phosphate responsive antiterminator [Anaerosalibacter massiliensis]|uniref:Glycerol-3-phosphate responsive antiterminator n=1 Tax=Anaerosalibacter massiliensis TaxID=1347392 RepID=A0A9X2MK73_9FIRM|nr:glycerol-3-phosphate responsive antiterminator [Anaerosalibacter massiliensis]MCR2044575.1 glycerol-3-phosphate responsive antiterminator [Anaerosalibacter massiliensis]
MDTSFFKRLESNPIIAAVNDLNNLDKAISSPCENIFLLAGNIVNLRDIVNKVRENNKAIYIHLDLIDGVSKDHWGLEYVAKNINPHGIITTKSNLIKYSQDLDIFAIQRLFVLDSLSLDTGIRNIKNTEPNAVEILPGIMPKIVKKVVLETRRPIITGGLIKDKEDVIGSLNSGAVAISTSDEKVWYM